MDVPDITADCQQQVGLALYQRQQRAARRRDRLRSVAEVRDPVMVGVVEVVNGLFPRAIICGSGVQIAIGKGDFAVVIGRPG